MMKSDNPFSFFEKIYCINLQTRTDRWEEVQVQFDKIGILDRVERLNAVTKEEAIKISKVKLKKSGDIQGQAAGSLSHYTCLKKSIESGVKNYLVFEDDVYFENYDANDLTQSIKELPTDWKMFMMGYNGWNRKRLDNFSSKLNTADAFGLAHAYAVNHVFYDQYKSEFEKRVIRGETYRVRWFKRIEYFLSHTCDNFHLMKNKFAFQEVGYSDIAQMEIDRETDTIIE